MSQDFLEEPALLNKYLRHYELGEIDEQWQEKIGSAQAIKIRAKGVLWSSSVIVNAEDILKYNLVVGFQSEDSETSYRILTYIDIVGVEQVGTTIFLSLVNTVISEPGVLVIRFEDANFFDGGFVIKDSQQLTSEWNRLVDDVISPVAEKSILRFSLEETFGTLTLLADALTREIQARKKEREAASVAIKNGTGQENSASAPDKGKSAAEKLGAQQRQSESTVRVALKPMVRREAPRSAVCESKETRSAPGKDSKSVQGQDCVQTAKDKAPALKIVEVSSVGFESPLAGKDTGRFCQIDPVSTVLGRANAAVFLGVSGPAPFVTPRRTPAVDTQSEAREAANTAAASAVRQNTRTDAATNRAPKETLGKSGRIPGVKIKAMKTKVAARMLSENPVQISSEDEAVEEELPRTRRAAARCDKTAPQQTPSSSQRPSSSTFVQNEAPPPIETTVDPSKPRHRVLPPIRQKVDGKWTSYPLAQRYDPAKAKAEISSTVYKKPPLKSDKDEKSFMDLRMKHNMEFRTRVDYMYLFGYEQHFYLPLTRMRPVNHETDGLMVYRKLKKDGVTSVYDKMSSLQFQKQVFTVMPKIETRPRSWTDICEDTEFIIINGQHTWAAATEVLKRESVPDPKIVEMVRLWECKIVWTTNKDHLHSLSYLSNDSNSGDAFCSSTSSAIMHCRRLWEDAKKPAQVRKNAARSGAQDPDEAARKKWEAFKDKAMQALIATLNPSVRRTYFDFDARGERYLVMASDAVWLKWEEIFKLHRQGDLKDVVTGRPIRLAKDWEYKPIGSNVREVSGLTDGEIGELADRILSAPAKVYLQPPPKDAMKRAKVHRAQSMKEWCVRKKQKKLALRELQRRVNYVRGDASYPPLDFNVYDLESNTVDYAEWDYVKSKHGLTSHHLDYILRSAGNFFSEQNKRPASTIMRSHQFTKAIDQVLVTRQRTLHMEVQEGLVLEYLHEEKKYSNVLMEYRRDPERRISQLPEYVQSSQDMSYVNVGCIIMDCRNFPKHPTDEINHLTENTFISGLEAVIEADMTDLRSIMCITTKNRAEIVKRMLERNWDTDVSFVITNYEPVGGELKDKSKAAELQISIVVMETGAGRAASASKDLQFEVDFTHRGVEPREYKQVHYRIEHRHCEFVGELRMELYLRYIDHYCDGDRAVLLMHAGTKAIRASRMLGRVCLSLHDLKSALKPSIFPKAFMEGLTMIPRAFFYGSRSPLMTKMPRYYLKTATGEEVPVGWDIESDSEVEVSGEVSEEVSGTGENSGRTPPGVSEEDASAHQSEQFLEQAGKVGQGSGDGCDYPANISSDDAQAVEEDIHSEEVNGAHSEEGVGAHSEEEDGAELGDYTEEDEVGREEDEVGREEDEVGSEEGEVGSEEGEVGSEEDEVGSEEDEVGSEEDEVGSEEDEVGSEDNKLETASPAHAKDEEGVNLIHSTLPSSEVHPQHEEPQMVPPGDGILSQVIEAPSNLNVVVEAETNEEGDVGGNVPHAVLVCELTMDTERIPITAETQILTPAALAAPAVDDDFLFHMLEQGSPQGPAVDVVLKELAEQRRANEKLQQRNAAMERRLAGKAEEVVIDLDEVDDEEMQESAAELNSLAQELRGDNVVKVEPLDSSQPQSSTPPPTGADWQSLSALQRCSLDVKPPVAHMWRQKQNELLSARKRKREYDELAKTQAQMLKLMVQGQERQEALMKSLKDSQEEIAYLWKFVPAPSPVDSFRPDQQSQLFSGISSGASPCNLTGRSTAGGPNIVPISEPVHLEPVDIIRAGDRSLNLERVDLLEDLVKSDSVVAPYEGGQPPSVKECMFSSICLAKRWRVSRRISLNVTEASQSDSSDTPLLASSPFDDWTPQSENTTGLDG